MTNSAENNLIEVFYSYSHKDEQMQKELEKHLKILRRQKLISDWHDRQITAGQNWENKINEYLEKAHIILLLVSIDFLDSDYCRDIEMDRALQRHAARKAVIIPVILRECDWRNTRLKEFQVLPEGAKPVSQWADKDSAYYSIEKGIEKVIAEIIKTNPSGLSKDWITSILMRKKIVRYVQEFLIKNDYLNDKADGIPGKKTKQAIYKFQTKYNLRTDGLIGPEVINKIQELDK